MATLSERVCLVIEMAVAESMRDDDPLLSAIYRHAHIASKRCPHPDWLADFEKTERAMIAHKVIPDIRRPRKKLRRRWLPLAAGRSEGWKS